MKKLSLGQYKTLKGKGPIIETEEIDGVFLHPRSTFIFAFSRGIIMRKGIDENKGFDVYLNTRQRVCESIARFKEDRFFFHRFFIDNPTGENGICRLLSPKSSTHKGIIVLAISDHHIKELIIKGGVFASQKEMFLHGFRKPSFDEIKGRICYSIEVIPRNLKNLITLQAVEEHNGCRKKSRILERRILERLPENVDLKDENYRFKIVERKISPREIPPSCTFLFVSDDLSYVYLRMEDKKLGSCTASFQPGVNYEFPTVHCFLNERGPLARRNPKLLLKLLTKRNSTFFVFSVSKDDFKTPEMWHEIPLSFLSEVNLRGYKVRERTYVLSERYRLRGLNLERILRVASGVTLEEEVLVAF